MKAIRFDRDGGAPRFDGASPEPALKPGYALVKVTRAAIGAPDLAVVRGATQFAGVLGHRFVGVVEKVEEKPGMTGAAKLVGKRVVGGINIVCGSCEMCRGGLSNHCRQRATIGLHNADGCLAERFAIPVVNLVEIPRTLHDDVAVFAVPLADALHAAQILRVEGKPFVTVLGDSCEALLVAQVTARLNASVRLLGRDPAKFGLCEKWGVKHRHADEVGRRQDQDVVVECTGDLSGLGLAMGLVRPRGKLVLKSAGAVLSGSGHALGDACAASPASVVDLTPVVTSEIEIVGARCGRVSEAVEALAKDPFDVLSLITSRVKLADAVEGFARAARPDAIAVLVEP